MSYAVGVLGSTFFIPLIIGLTTKHVSKEAAIASSVGGAFVCGVWTWACIARATWAQDIHPGVIGLATGGVLIFVVAAMTKPLDGVPVAKFFPEKA